MTWTEIRLGDAIHVKHGFAFKGQFFASNGTHVVLTPGNFEEQRSIGRVLCSYDSLIGNNQRRIQLLEQAARLLYEEWFVHLRFPGHERVTITDGVPEGMRKVRCLKRSLRRLTQARDLLLPHLMSGEITV